MSKNLHDTIGNTVDALLRPRTPLPASGVLRVADLGGMNDAARDAGLEVVYVNQGEEVGDISVYDQIPPFDLLAVDLGEAPDDALAFALRFLRVRRPVAFLLTDEADRDDVDAGFLAAIEAQTQRLGYRIYSRGAFVIGVIWPEPFAWPDEATAQAVLDKMARLTLANAQN